MTYDENLTRIRDLARSVVEACVAEIERMSLERGSPLSRERPEDEFERSVLAFILIGARDRADRRGVPWADVQADAEFMLSEFAKLPVTRVIQ